MKWAIEALFEHGYINYGHDNALDNIVERLWNKSSFGQSFSGNFESESMRWEGYGYFKFVNTEESQILEIQDVQTRTNNYYSIEGRFESDTGKFTIYSGTDGLPQEFVDAVDKRMIGKYPKFKKTVSWIEASFDDPKSFFDYFATIDAYCIHIPCVVKVDFDMTEWMP